MFGFAELIIKLLDWILPNEVLESYRKKLLTLRLRAATIIPESSVVVFAEDASLRNQFKENLFSGNLDDTKIEENVKYSLVTTCFNEASHIYLWLESVASQQLLPDEVIIVDAGSKDNTLAEVRRWQNNNKVNLEIEIYCLESCNIAEGRNLGVKKSRNKLIAFSDIGTELDRFWAKKLLRPFILIPNLEVSMGWYKVITKYQFFYSLSIYLSPQIKEVSPKYFLPSARSLAIKKDTFFSVNGFPEFLSLAGEDSLFDYYLKCSAKNFAFVPEAIVFWHFPKDLIKAAKTIIRYARGDAESGKLFWSDYLNLSEQYIKLFFEVFSYLLLRRIFDFTDIIAFHWLSLLILAGAILRFIVFVLAYQPGNFLKKEVFFNIIAALFLSFNQFVGFVWGLSSRKEILNKRLQKAKSGHVLMFLSEPPSRDVDTEEKVVLQKYLETNYFVSLIFTAFPKTPTTQYQHQFLESYLRSAFNVEEWAEAYQLEVAKTKKGKLEIVDKVNDSFSRQIVEKIRLKK